MKNAYYFDCCNPVTDCDDSATISLFWLRLFLICAKIEFFRFVEHITIQIHLSVADEFRFLAFLSEELLVPFEYLLFQMLDVKSLILVRFFQLIIFFFKLRALLHSGFICCFQFFVCHSKSTPFPEIPDGS